ncbi:MAG: hypothetical protein OXI01_00440 [Albidovulum sp.]|nr:hypothetical protein [Albidovulum sp.]
MIKRELPLEYRLAPGWLTPWIESVVRGETLARSCRACGRISFVPERVCECGCAEGIWKSLPGTATVIRRTFGADGSFGLVRFDYADTCTVVELDGFELGNRRGKLVPPGGHLPKLILQPEFGAASA